MALWLVGAFMVQVGFAAANAVLYVMHGRPISLGAAIFCGALAVWTLVTARNA